MFLEFFTRIYIIECIWTYKKDLSHNNLLLFHIIFSDNIYNNVWYKKEHDFSLLTFIIQHSRRKFSEIYGVKTDLYRPVYYKEINIYIYIYIYLYRILLQVYRFKREELQLEFSRTRFSRKDRRYYSLSQASLLPIIKGLMRWQVDVPAGSVETARHTNGLKKFLARFQSTKLIF